MYPAARVCVLITAFVLLWLTASSVGAQAAEPEEPRAVLVTGASTGIGRRITEVLAERGYFVYAGARKQKDIDALNAIDNVQAIELDVTLQKQIDEAVNTVAAGGRGLWGLVNNAGVFIGGPLIDVDIRELEWLMDVNVNGVYRVTQAFSPMIIESKGRITSIGSISGILSSRFSGHYSMSKHAVEAFTDSLAAEMAPLGVHVSVIEPGSYNSAIANSALARMRQKSEAYAKAGSPFAAEFDSWISRDWDRGIYKEPDEVAEAAMHALFAKQPLRRYMVVPNAQEAGWTIRKQVQELIELNAWQAYPFSREEIVGMLDDIAASDDDVETLTSMLHQFLANSSQKHAHSDFWADELVYTSSNGTRQGKAEIMNGFDETPGRSDEPEIVYTGQDVNVQLFGTSAVVTFKLVGMPSDGSEARHYFNTGTFLKRNGRWQAIAWQATVIPTG